MGIKWFRELRENYDADVFCMNCRTSLAARIKNNTRIKGTEVVCPVCKIKDRIRIGENGFGGESFYIN